MSGINGRLIGAVVLMLSSLTVYLSSFSIVANCGQEKLATDMSAQTAAAMQQQQQQQTVRIAAATQNKSTDPSAGSLHDLALCTTSSRDYETIFYALSGLLLREEGMIPAEGDLLDVGAQFGENACHFALLQPHRQVYTLDPSPSNIERIQKQFGQKLPNLHAVQAGIGQELGEREADNPAFNMQVGKKFKVETLDNLFYNQGKKLAFAHLDVEGLELPTLKGGVKTIRDNSPVFTVELRVHVPEAKDLLDFIDNLGYDVYIVEEVCGAPAMDWRNAICFPRSLSPKLTESDAIALALATEVLFRVDSSTIEEKVLPCCKMGGACCPSGDPKDKNCCSERLVNKWRSENPQPLPIVVSAWRPARRKTKERRNELIQRGKIKV